MRFYVFVTPLSDCSKHTAVASDFPRRERVETLASVTTNECKTRTLLFIQILSYRNNNIISRVSREHCILISQQRRRGTPCILIVLFAHIRYRICAMMTIRRTIYMYMYTLVLLTRTCQSLCCRRMNVTGFPNDFAGDGHRACGARLTVGTYYVLFADVAHGRLVAKDRQGALVEWTDDNERSVWHGLGECAIRGRRK